MTAPTVPDLPLRDIHLPEPLSWWPPAPGWWILLALIMVIGIFGWKTWRERHRRHRLRTLKQQLASIRNRFEQVENSHETILALSVLLRRACLSFFPRPEVASLTGERWLRFLTDTSGVGINDELGRLLTEAPYRRLDDIDNDQVTRLIYTIDDQLDAIYRKSRR